MKDYFNKLLFIIIIIICLFFSISFIVLKKDNFSYEENRYLESFNINNIEKYFSDHFPFRKFLISFKNNIEKNIGKTYINNVYLAKDNYLITPLINNNKKDLIIDVINKFANKNSDLLIDVMFVPDSILINEDKLHYHLPINEEEEINYLYSKLLYTNNINLIKPLKEDNKKNNNLYYKTDHHWTSYGAYIAYKEYTDDKIVQGLSLDNFNIKTICDDFKGTTSSQVLGLSTQDKITLFKTNNKYKVEYVYENKITDSLYNFDYLKKKDKYSIFLDNNHALIKITNESIENDNSVLVIKNSFGNTFIPFITNNYKCVYVIDMRYYNKDVSDFIKANNIYDVLILYNMINMYSDMSIVKLK